MTQQACKCTPGTGFGQFKDNTHSNRRSGSEVYRDKIIIHLS